MEDTSQAENLVLISSVGTSKTDRGTYLLKATPIIFPKGKDK